MDKQVSEITRMKQKPYVLLKLLFKRPLTHHPFLKKFKGGLVASNFFQCCCSFKRC